jgi:hypothetical protein
MRSATRAATLDGSAHDRSPRPVPRVFVRGRRLLAAVALLAGCVAGGLVGTAWCMARRLRRVERELPVPPAAPSVATLPPPDDRRPGWRDDPAGGGRRLWDGEHWTQHVWSDRRRST